MQCPFMILKHFKKVDIEGIKETDTRMTKALLYDKSTVNNILIRKKIPEIFFSKISVKTRMPTLTTIFNAVFKSPSHRH